MVTRNGERVTCHGLPGPDWRDRRAGAADNKPPEWNFEFHPLATLLPLLDTAGVTDTAPLMSPPSDRNLVLSKK